VAADRVEAAAMALKAGVDIDMVSGAYIQGLPEALERGLVDRADIDRSVRRVLSLKKRLGLFDDPYSRGRITGSPDAGDPRRLARDVGRRAIVLLTHKGKALPLAHGTRRIALVGPLAAAAGEMLGPWAAAGRAEEAVSLLEGLTMALPRCRIDTVPGVDIQGEDISGIPAALNLCREAEIVLLCLGEAATMSGEAASRGDLDLPGRQRDLAEAVLALGKPVVVLLSSGRPLTLPWLFERADAVLATWFLGSEAGHAIADVLTGRFNPTGRLPVSWPCHVGQVPIFYAQRPSGRPTKIGEHYTSGYLDLPAAPQFPFGHGLSYSRFALADLRCDPPSIHANECVTVSVTVSNLGHHAGETTLFLFVHDEVASVARPIMELKGVRKIRLAAGEHGKVAWSLNADAFSFLGESLETVLESGSFEIHVGESADRAACLTASLQLVPR
jgi:beta-glucosidase